MAEKAVTLHSCGHRNWTQCNSVLWVFLFPVSFWDGHLLHELICYKVGELHIQSEVCVFPPPAKMWMWEGVSLGKGFFLPSRSPTVFVFWFFCVRESPFLYIHFSIVAKSVNVFQHLFVWKLFLLLVSYSFFSLTNCWNYETVIKNAPVVNNKCHLFWGIYAIRINSNILQNHSISILHSCRHLKVQPIKL